MYNNCFSLNRLRPTIEQICYFNDYTEDFSCAKDFGKSSHQNHDKINSPAGVVQLEANLPEELRLGVQLRNYTIRWQICRKSLDAESNYAITPFDGKCWNLQMSSTHSFVRCFLPFQRYNNFKFVYLKKYVKVTVCTFCNDIIRWQM